MSRQRPAASRDPGPDDRHLFARGLHGILEPSLQLAPVVGVHEALEIKFGHGIRLEPQNIEAGGAGIQGLPLRIHHQGDIGGALGDGPVASGRDLGHQPGSHHRQHEQEQQQADEQAAP